MRACLKRIAMAAAGVLILAQPALVMTAVPGIAAAAVAPTCAAGYYENSRGRCVRRPTRTPDDRPPAGASARCRDGTYSFSQSRRGTCSGHGGVAAWL
ncbi:DUF3761 domain-containing protein [Brevundimonas sp.]|uniref:DUF3761 domain-containing protein n=1 Tax=Brevundimonas sp. TaxID=1871086 RepID=UPI002D4E1DBA|nr:DUF3761 domain-containing protein [Brevundimonas sp.]HYC98460.1 DUF3761 domain-containing protein [Brevundimonas sp.]